MSITRIGQIGLGVIGELYAEHLFRHQGHLDVHDVDTRKKDRWTARGVKFLETAAAVAGANGTIVLSLPNPEAVRQAMLGDRGILQTARQGSLIIDTSTIDPPTCKAMHQAAQGRGVGYLEAPVSGGQPGGAGTDGARAANITFMVGGCEDDFRRAIPVFEILGQKWHYLGGAGAGSTVKLISNHLAGLYNLCASEAFVLGAAAGFPPATLLKVFQDTDAKSFWMTEYMAPRLERMDFEPGFSVDLQYKDHRLVGELAQRLKVPMLFNQLAVEVYQMLRSRGLGAKDLVESINLMSSVASVDLSGSTAGRNPS